MNNRKILPTFVAVLFLIFVGACDVLEQSPSASLPTDQIFTSESNVRAVLAGAYDGLQDAIPFSYRFAELAGEDVGHTGSFPSWAAVDQHSLLAGNAEASALWTMLYEVIAISNNLIANTPAVEVDGFTEEEKTAIIAEAKIIRALCYHSLERWYGGVPLVLEPIEGVSEEINVSRATSQAVYDQIILDLTAAATALGNTGEPGAFTANGFAAKALLSRVYLYTGQYDLAEQAATDVINSGVYTLPEAYISNWGATASASPSPDEIIWSIQFTSEDSNALAFFAFPSVAGGRIEYAPVPRGIDDYEPEDERINANFRVVAGTTVIGKYFRIVNGDDNVIVIRLGEVYLNRAEARARQGDLTGALADVNVIRERAGLDPAGASSQSELLGVILLERGHELFMEGHRWFDLKRFGVAQSLLNINNPDNLLWPIPESEIDSNPNLEQNPGY